MLHAQQLSIALVVTIAAINVLASTSGSMTRDRITRTSENKHKFISFDTDEETIEGENPAIINFNALMLLGIIAIIGTMIGSIRVPDVMSLDSSGLSSLFKNNADNDMESSNWLLASLKSSMMQEDGLLNECAQKFVCLTANEALERRRKGENTQMDTLIAEISQRVQVGDVKLGGSVAKAVRRAFSAGGCKGFFGSCSVKINPMQHYLK